MIESDMLTISQAAEEFGIPRIKLYRWMKAGRLSAFRSGRDERSKLVRRGDVEALLGQAPIALAGESQELKSAA